MPDPAIYLRPFREGDLDLLTQFSIDPAVSEPFEWFGFRSPEAFRRRWQEDGFLDQDPHYLAVTSRTDDAVVGWVMWRHGFLGIQAGIWEIGILLLPEHRGQGVGTLAQRLLVEHLFATTTAHRIWAGTQSDNVAEQRALEKCGFQCEGRLRESVFRAGQWHDSLVYGMLRRES